MMIKRICPLLAMVLLAFAAEARPVSSDEAALVARAWVNRGRDNTRLGVKFRSSKADATAVHTTENDAIFYTVKMAGGGTVFLSGDTAFEPVIGFTSATDDFSTIDEKSPLWALLNRDVSRMKAAKKLKLTTSSATTASTTTASDAKWAALIAEGQELDKLRLSTLSAAKDDPPDDLRVPNLVESQWSQRDVGGKACYNYYTPNGTDPEKFTPGSTTNAVCGCVATAISQVMRYFKYPTAPVTPVTHKCTYNKDPIELTMQGGTYDWDNMTLVPARGTLTEDNRKAIGKLTSDAGIAAWMNYTPSSSGAYLFEGAQMMHDVFGYANVVTYDNWVGTSRFIEAGGKIRAEALERTMFSNFDAGKPVLVSIPGHAVLADGYGYDESGVDYVHFNMGWSGQSDYWYNIPDLTKASGGFNAIEFISYNIFTNDAATCAIISGRTIDDEGMPIANATIKIYDSESRQVVRETATNERGIWAAILEKGQYDVEARQGGLIAELSNLELTCPITYSGGYTEYCDVTMTSPAKPSGLGNSWGNDMVLAEPTVRIVRDVGGDPETNLFTTLDKALGAAHENDLVEIVLPTLVKKPVTVVSNCTIVATNEDIWASAITQVNGSVITVTNGVTLTVSNIAFDVPDNTKTIEVVEGGVLKVGSTCALEAIETAAWNNLVVDAVLEWPLAVDCATAKGEGETCATATIDYETATNCACYLLHYSNTRLGGEAYTNDAGNVFVRWSRDAPIPLRAAVGRLDVGEGPVNKRSLGDLFEDYDRTTDARIVVCKSTVITNYLADIPHAIDIAGARDRKGHRPIVTVMRNSAFDIPREGSLALSNIVFVGSAPTNEVSEMIFIRVNGGELTLGDGAEICGFTGRVDGKSGVIDLLDGTATMKNGAVIRDCVARGLSRGRGQGGAIYVAPKATCTLNLEGGTITNCWAATYGGGVYAYLSADAAYSPFVNVSGELTIAGNRSANSAKDDLYLGSDKTMAQFRVVGEVDGRIGITYPGFGSGNAEGDAFIANGLSDSVSEGTLYSFFNDTLDGMIAAEGTGEKAGMLVWAKDPRDPRQCDESEAAARLIAGSTTNYWREVSDALSEAQTSNTVEVLSHGASHVPLSASVTLAGRDITLCAEAGSDPFELARGCDVTITIPAGSALVVTNLTLSGYDVSREDWPLNEGPLFDVNGGTLAVTSAVIRYVYGYGKRDANAITVCNGGELVASDLQIEESCNFSIDPTVVKMTEDGAGGAILVDHATAHLVDTTIDGCEAWKGGGVFACNGSTVYLSGETQITNNFVVGQLDVCNMELSEDSSLVLEGGLSNRVGVTSLDNSVAHPGDTNRVATVGYTWKTSLASLTNSAACFRRDGDGDVGVAVTNDATALIVWSTALKDGQYVDPRGGKIYLLVGEMPAPPEKANPEPPVVGEATITILNVKPVDDGFAITVLATEGGKAVPVASEKVTGLFEATTDLGDWTTKKVELTVESSVQNGDSTTTFIVKPAGNPNTVFIRLVQ